jgi:hypothetical protein
MRLEIHNLHHKRGPQILSPADSNRIKRLNSEISMQKLIENHVFQVYITFFRVALGARDVGRVCGL